MAGRASLGWRAASAALVAVIALAGGACGEGRPLPRLTSDTSTPPDSTEAGGRDRWRELRGDMTLIQAYGAEHPDDYGGFRYREDNPDTELIVWFTADLDVHEAALRAKAEHPDRLQVERARMSKRERDRIVGELRQRSDVGTVSGYGRGGEQSGASPIAVELRSHQSDLAGELVAQYGDKIAVVVGQLPYPDPGDTDVCDTLPAASERTPGLELKVALPTTTLSSSSRAGIEGAVTIRNGGARPLWFETGYHAAAYVLDDRGRVIRSPYGPMPAAARFHDLPSGGESSLDFGLDAEPCRSGYGWTLPAGTYLVVVVVRGHPDARAGGRSGDTVVAVSDPVPFTVTP